MKAFNDPAYKAGPTYEEQQWACTPKWQRILLFWMRWLPDDRYSFWRWYHHLINLVFLPLFLFYVYVFLGLILVVAWFLYTLLGLMTNQYL